MWGLALAGIGTAILGSRSAGRAADAQQAASEASVAEQRRQYDTALRLLEPQRNIGYQALGDLAALYGYSTPGYQPASQLLAGSTAQGYGTFEPGTIPGAIGRTANGLIGRMIQGRADAAGGAYPGAIPGQPAGQPGNMSRFFASPDYDFRRKEGERGIAASFAAKGGGGRALQALAEYNSNLASGEYGNYVNRLFNMAGMGQTATNSAIGAGANYANNASQAQMAAGDARASGAIGQANAITGSLNNMLGMYYMNQWMNPSAGGGSGGYSTVGPWAGGYQFPGTTGGINPMAGISQGPAVLWGR